MAFYRKIRLIAWLGAAVVALGMPAAQAWPSWCPSGKCPAKKVETFDTQAQQVIWEVSHNPALMNIDYLQYYIGRPEGEELQRGSVRHYYWYDRQRQPVYDLIQQESAPGMVTDSTMVVHLTGMGLTFDKLDKLYGKQSRRFFDYSGHPNELFSFAPNTSLAFGSPQNSFRLNQAKIIYRGAALPAPTADDMAAAESAMIARARTAALASASANSKAKGKNKGKNGQPANDQEYIPLLMTRVRTQPYNAEAHLHLALALQKQARVYEAIGEYKLALALSGDDPQVRDQSLKALGDMQLLPPENPVPRRNFEIVDNGQHMRVVGNEQPSQQQPPPQFQPQPQTQQAQNPDASAF